MATIYAAIIEWPSEPPTLIMERSDAARLSELRSELSREYPDATTSAEYQEAAVFEDTDTWISLYEREI